MRILVLSPLLPDFPSDGDKLRLHRFLRELGKRHVLTLAAFGDANADLGLLDSFVHETHILPMPRFKQWLNFFLNFFSSAPANTSAYASGAMRSLVDSLLAKKNFDAVLCYRLRMAPYALRAKLPRVLDCTDSMTRYWERRASQASGWRRLLFRREAQKIAAYEAWCAGQFEAALMNSSQDAATLKAMAPGARVLVAANGADFENLKPLGLKRDPEQMIFVGNLAYAPNAEGLLWFWREAFPLILKARPEAKLLIVGGQAPPSLQALRSDPAVKFLGFAKDMNPWLNKAGLSICPVRLAAGRQNKILDAFVTATPVLATQLTARGVEARPGHELLAADSAEDFAKAALRVMASPGLGRRLGVAGRNFVRKHYDWAASARVIERAFFKP